MLQLLHRRRTLFKPTLRRLIQMQGAQWLAEL
jgi:hypothetical protein